jgi:hypothetical protein
MKKKQVRVTKEKFDEIIKVINLNLSYSFN